MIIHQIHNSYGNYTYNAVIYNEMKLFPHFHRNYEIIYCLQGKTEVKINGERVILNADETVLIAPYTVHTFIVGKEDICWIGVLSEDFIISFAEQHRHSRFSKFKCDPSVDAFLKKYLFVEEEPDKYKLMGCLYLLCNECQKNAERCGSIENIRMVERITDYISQNLDHDVSLMELSEALGYEYHYCSAIYHDYFSLNFKSFLNIFRFERACKLLTDNTKEITDISIECGFGSIRTFNRVFKQLSGQTPSEYRKNLH